jgi:hypothetical protein
MVIMNGACRIPNRESVSIPALNIAAAMRRASLRVSSLAADCLPRLILEMDVSQFLTGTVCRDSEH